MTAIKQFLRARPSLDILVTTYARHLLYPHLTRAVIGMTLMKTELK